MTTHRERLLGQARADLVALPDLVAELARLVADRHHDIGGYRGKVIGSPAPLQIPVVHLIDDRHKPGWHGADPRIQDLGDRYGITPTLETWVRIVWEELPGAADLTEEEAWLRTAWGHLPAVIELTESPTVRSECALLVEYWPFIEAQQWANELAEDVQRITAAVKAQLGIRPEYRPKCPTCGWVVEGVYSDNAAAGPAWWRCTGCPKTWQHDAEIQRLAVTQPPLTLREISRFLSIPLRTLYNWEVEGRFLSVGRSPRGGKTFEVEHVKQAAQRA